MDNRELIQREVDARAKDELDARAVLQAAADESREPTAEEEARFDQFIASADVRKARIEKLTKLEADKATVESLRAGLPEPKDDPVDEPEKRGQIGHLVEMIRAFKETNVEQAVEWRLPDASEHRAIADFSDSASLYVSDFLGRLVVYLRATSPWFDIATVISGDGRPLILPNLTADPTVYAPGEGTAITESSPTLGTVTATPVSYKALSYISWESAEDEQVGLLGAIAQSQGRALGYFAGTAITATVLTGAGNGGTATGTPFFAATDLIDLFYRIPPSGRNVGSWVMANGAMSKARKFTDANGQFLWVPALTIGQPDAFLGRPVYEDPGLATPASATKSVLFGDASTVFIKQAPLRVATSTDARFANDQIAIKSVLRAGAALPDAGAIKYLVSGAS